MYLPLEVLALCGLAAVATLCMVIVVGPPIKAMRIASAEGFRFKRKPAFAIVGTSALGDPASQLRHVMAASFYKKKLMNKAEYRVFKVVESEVQARRDGCRVLSQTSLGEIIGSDNQKAFDSVNSKRVDILIMGPYGDPIAVIEYQGSGHHQGTAAARDAIKREALRRAGVHFVEILQDHSADEIAQLVRRIFQPSDFARPHPQPHENW
jgi:hypothetical protein